MSTTNKHGGVIYKATFENGKSYIGQTKVSLNKRKNQHKGRAKKLKEENNTKYAFYNAINKYGFETINWETLKKVDTDEELNEREIYWIKYYHTYINDKKSNGYNSTRGGQRLEIPLNLSENEFKNFAYDCNSNMTGKEISFKYQIGYEKVKKIRRLLKQPGYYERIIQGISDHGKLSTEVIDKILDDFKQVGSCRKVADMNNIDNKTVNDIIQGKSWASYTKILDNSFYEEYKKYGTSEKYRFTKKQILFIANLYKQGKTVKEIESLVDFDITHELVMGITGGRKFANITQLPHISGKKRKEKLTPQQQDELYLKKKQGVTEKELMELYGCSRACIQKTYKRIKILKENK